MSILQFKDVSNGFGEGTNRAEILKHINLDVKEGEFLAILGFSGTGKSTLMNLIAGLEEPDSGKLTFRGKAIEGPGPDRGLVFQSYSLMPWLSVRGNIMLAVEAVHRHLFKAEKVAKADHYIAMVGLPHAAHRLPAELSGGMRQRVAVARALAMEPDLLLLDEPLSALDALTRANLADEILEIWEADKKTCIMVTNDVDEAILLADRIIVLNPDGTLADPVKVDIPRPRNRDAMNHDVSFKKLRAQVTQYLMDVGFAAKVAETRQLPNVSPIHQTTPAVVKAAREGLIEERFLDFSQLHKIYATRAMREFG